MQKPTVEEVEEAHAHGQGPGDEHEELSDTETFHEVTSDRF